MKGWWPCGTPLWLCSVSMLMLSCSPASPLILHQPPASPLILHQPPASPLRLHQPPASPLRLHQPPASPLRLHQPHLPRNYGENKEETLTTTENTERTSLSSDTPTKPSTTTTTTVTSPTTPSTSLTTPSTTSTTPSTAITSTSTPVTTSTSTTTNDPPLTPAEEETLFQDTQTELNNINNILDKLSKLVNQADSKTRVRHPFGWGLVSHDPSLTGNAILTPEPNQICADPSYPTCIGLYGALTKIEKLMDILLGIIDNWDRSDYDNLKQAEDALSTNEEDASKDDNFTSKICKVAFSNYVQTVQLEVQNGETAADARLSELKKTRTDRVIFVSVIGTVGGLMIVAVVAVLIFSSYKRYKAGTESSLNKSSDKEEYMDNASPSPKSTRNPMTNPDDIYTRPHAPKDDRHYSARDYKDNPSGRRDQSSRHDPYTRKETNHRTNPYPRSISNHQHEYSRDNFRD